MVNDFQEIIKKDREQRPDQEFTGSFLDYLEIAKAQPEVASLAHERMYRIIMKPGVEVIKTENHKRLRRIYGNDRLRRYAFFEQDFFGIEKTIMEIVRYFYSAAMRGEESRQVLYLVGPVAQGSLR